MAKEIERKFLVRDDSYKALAYDSIEIEQGYLSTDPNRTVRIRRCGPRAFITVKSRNCGAVRNEWEYEIPASDAAQMLELCGEKRLCKRRWLLRGEDGHIWEIDEFAGALAPLVIAEVELAAADEPVIVPPFIAQEVTGNPAYYNSSLCGC